MEHHIDEEQGFQIITLSGEIDLESSPQVRQVLLNTIDGYNNILLDMNAVTFIDSSGIATLVEAFQRAKKQGGQLALMRLNPAVVRVLSLARLDKVFTIHSDKDSAIHVES